MLNESNPNDLFELFALFTTATIPITTDMMKIISIHPQFKPTAHLALVWFSFSET